jgi:hypothetical protein
MSKKYTVNGVVVEAENSLQPEIRKAKAQAGMNCEVQS